MNIYDFITAQQQHSNDPPPITRRVHADTTANNSCFFLPFYAIN